MARKRGGRRNVRLTVGKREKRGKKLKKTEEDVKED